MSDFLKRAAAFVVAPLVLVVAGLVTPLSAQGGTRPLYDEGTVRDLHLTFTQLDYVAQIKATWRTENYVKGDLTVDGKVYTGVGVRMRGYSSASVPAGSDKVPLRISMDEFHPGQELMGYKTLKLNNALWDPSMVREVLGYHLYRRYMPAPQANFVNVYMNGRYFGVYTNVQSVDAVFTKEHFRTDHGNRYEAFGPMRDWGALNIYQVYFPLRSKDRGTNHADIVALCQAYGSKSVPFLETELPKRLAIDHLYRHLAGVVLTGHTDSHIGKDYYLYGDPHTGVFYTVPWDLNLGMRFQYWPGPTSSHAFPLTVTAYEQRFLAHLRVMASESLDVNALVARAQAYQALIDPFVQKDTNAFYTLAEFRSAVTARVGGTPSIQEFFAGARSALLQRPGFGNVAPALSEPSSAPAQPTGRDPLTFRVRATGSSTVRVTGVSLFVRNAGPFVEVKMFDDGNHGDGAPGDGVFGVQQPAQLPGSVVEYYFATYNGPTVGFLPATAGYRPYALEVPPARDSALIHEFVADNDKGVRDNFGEREDWVELFNPGTGTVDLRGAYLTDNRFEPKKWALPAQAQIPAGQALVVWADEDPAQGPMHAAFKLSKDGEEIALFASDGRTMLDHVRFGPQQSDVSTGRVEDRLSPLVTFPDPTPGAANDVQPCGIRRWSALDPATHRLALDARVPAAPFVPRLGATLYVDLTGAAPSGPVLMLADAAPGNAPVQALGVSLLVSGRATVSLPATADGQGRIAAPLAIPQQPQFAGLRICMQGLALVGARVEASNGVAVRFCR